MPPEKPSGAPPEQKKETPSSAIESGKVIVAAIENLEQLAIPQEIKDLLAKYQSKGWVTQNPAYGRPLNADEISVSSPVRGPDPIFKYQNGIFSPVNYPGSYKPMNVQAFEEHIKKYPHK